MVSSTNITDCHDITEILLKVALLFMVSINQHGLEVARRCYSGEEVEKAL
jgi:hypothetical protein